MPPRSARPRRAPRSSRRRARAGPDDGELEKQLGADTWAAVQAIKTDVADFARQFPTIGYDEATMKYRE